MVLFTHWSNTGIAPAIEAQRYFLSIAPPEVHYNALYVLQALWDKLARFTSILQFQFAHAGVMLFFLVSGFVIPISAERYSAPDFLIRRAFRLLPMVWATVAAWIVLHLCLRLVGYADAFPFSARQVVANLFLVHDWFWFAHIDQGYWTLLVEVKFYVAVAATIIIAKRLTVGSVAALVGFLALACGPLSGLGDQSDYSVLYSAAGDRPWLFYYFRVLNGAAPFMIYMLAGTVMFMWRDGRISFGAAFVGVSAIFALFAVSNITGPDGVGGSIYVADGLRVLVLFCVLLMVDQTGVLRGRAPRVAKTLRFFGAISYPLYLTHGLIGMSIILAVYNWTGSINCGLAAAALIVFPLSWMLHVLVEEPTRKMGGTVATFLSQVHLNLQAKRPL